ncbi:MULTISPECIES: hypothetical protein [unclassified Paenibacillus]|uniref:hypothetical protein n=1 Tax=unclassified Paenibacillus TaxID=185978 RepID=UPI000837AD3E|nr:MULTISPECIES: hypothetical protein [unclassified Paenibacillus]NWL89805.1 hypothetical protein [Paenibacillus sp. 79R4]
MYKFMLFLHIVGTLALGFYLVLPFVMAKVNKLSSAAQEGTMSAVKSLNTFAQIGLVIQLLSGGYMISKGEYSVPWMIIIVILFLGIGAVGGIMGKPLRLAIEGIRANRSISAESSKLATLSYVVALLVLLISFFMVFSSII